MTAPRAAFVEQVMGLPVSVHVRGPAARCDAVREAVTRAFASLHEADAVFSTYRPDSDVARIRRGELAVAAADPLVAEVLAIAEDARARTDGRFDVRLPDPDGVRRLDPSGVVKGWAAERAGGLLRDDPTLDGHDWCLNAGGDVLVGGHLPDAAPWRIGVERPGGPGLVAVVELHRGAVATSGSAARGDHVLDPRSGRPARGLRSATVTGPSLLWADVLATAAFVAGRDALRWMASVPGYEALVVTDEEDVLRSPAFPASSAAALS
ncbi:FAD:protein FMN transferase [Angustibacter aerolatus]